MKVYVVQGSAGEYDTYREWVAGIFSSKEEADLIATKLACDNQDKLKATDQWETEWETKVKKALTGKLGRSRQEEIDIRIKIAKELGFKPIDGIRDLEYTVVEYELGAIVEA